MSYFLRNYADTRSAKTRHFLLTDSTYTTGSELASNIHSKAQAYQNENYNAQYHQAHQDFSLYRALYSELLASSACQIYGNYKGLLKKFGDEFNADANNKNDDGLGYPSTSRSVKDSDRADLTDNVIKKTTVWKDACKYLTVIAPPSDCGAYFLTRTIAIGSESISKLCFNHNSLGNCYPNSIDDCGFGFSTVITEERTKTVLKSIAQKTKSFGEYKLVAISLESIFSILLKLKERDTDLCVSLLQSIISLLQGFGVESLSEESHPLAEKMHSFLEQLRTEGNVYVSSLANTCMISLATAYGSPLLFFSTVCSLLCDLKKNVPFNQQSSDQTILPRNFHALALVIQNALLVGSASLKSTENSPTCCCKSCYWVKKPLHYFECFVKFCVDFNLYFSESQKPSLSCKDINKITPSKLKFTTCIASNGSYLFVLTRYGLFKIGTGLSETRAGEIITFNETLKFCDGTTLHVCSESLYLRHRHSLKISAIDVESLCEIGEITLPSALLDGVLYSDGNHFFHATFDGQWNFVSTTLDDNFCPMTTSCQQDTVASVSTIQKNRLNIRLAKFECISFGEINSTQRNFLSSIPNSLQAVVVDIQIGENVGFILTRFGKVFYAGCGSAFDLKTTNTGWNELNFITEAIVSMVFDQYHGCLFLRTGLGSLWCLGNSSAFHLSKKHFHNHVEDVPSTTKKLKKIRILNRRKCVGMASCGGCLAYITENGRCHFHGDHPAISANSFIENFDLKNISAANLQMGKAHMVIISKNGLLYTCGLNNFNQCGRSSGSDEKVRDSPLSTALHSAPQRGSPITHLFDSGELYVCSKCRKKSSGLQNTRNHDQEEFRTNIYSKCGLCEVCAISPNAQVEELRTDEPDEAGTNLLAPSSIRRLKINANFSNVKTQQMEKKSFSDKDHSISTSESGPSRLINEAMIQPLGRVILSTFNSDIKVSSVSCGNYHTIVLCADHRIFTFGSNCHGQLGTGDTYRRTSSYCLDLPTGLQIVQAVAGANHCILRSIDGKILTFGAYGSGQLIRARPQPQSPMTSRSNASNSRHWFSIPTVVPGYGPGYDKIANWVGAQGDCTFVQTLNQLISKSDLSNSHVMANGHCVMIFPPANSSTTAISNRDSKNSSINVQLQQKRIQSNKFESYIVIRCKADCPNSDVFFDAFNCRKENDSSFFYSSKSFCLDPFYSNLLWGFDSDKLAVFALRDRPTIPWPPSNNDRNLEKSDENLEKIIMRHCFFLNTPELILPSEADSHFSETQTAIFLLNTIYSLNLFTITGMVNPDGEYKYPIGHELYNVDAEIVRNCVEPPSSWNVINRFESFGGGWGYSAHCIEAIQFKVNRDIVLCGVGLFGGRGEYTTKLKLFKVIGVDNSEEQCIELLDETNETFYECVSRDTACIRFNHPTHIVANQWYLISAKIQGPNSDCGAGGNSNIKSESGTVHFQFRSSLLSNNGTDVDVGQLPEIYFTFPENVSSREANNKHTECNYETKAFDVPTKRQLPSMSKLMSAKRLFGVGPEIFAPIFCILKWSFNGVFHSSEIHTENSVEDSWKQERAAFIAILSLRLIRHYVKIIYEQIIFNEEALSNNSKITKFADAIFEFYYIIANCFETANCTFVADGKTGSIVIGEVIEAYVGCSQFFTPSPSILRHRLNRAIRNVNSHGSFAYTWHLLAILEVFRNLQQYILAVLNIVAAEEDENLKTPLISELLQRFSKELFPDSSADGALDQLDPNEIINFLFNLALSSSSTCHTNEDNKKLLINRLEISSQSLIAEIGKLLIFAELCKSSEILICKSPVRFLRTVAESNWETSGSAYDAISFTLNSNELLLHGVGVYLGEKLAQQYELELLAKEYDSSNESWILLERVAGSVSSTDGLEPILKNTSDEKISPIFFRKPLKLLCDVCYAIRLLFVGSERTFYGEGGVSTIRLQNDIHINFLPCSLSHNGTTVSRGQIPCFYYSVEKYEGYAVKKENLLGGYPNDIKVQTTAGLSFTLATGEKESNEKTNEGGTVDEDKLLGQDVITKSQQLFLAILRQLAKYLSAELMCANDAMLKEMDTNEHFADYSAIFRHGHWLCGKLFAYTNVFLETQPSMAFSVVAILDSVLPLLTNLNANEEENAVGSSEELKQNATDANSLRIRSSEVRDLGKDKIAGNHSSECKKINELQTTIESLHSYKPAQIYIQCVHLDKMVDFLCLTFHNEYRSAQAGDMLSIFAETSKNSKNTKGSSLYLVRRYFHVWPKDVLLVPGNRVWFVFETANTQPSLLDEVDDNKVYGFRCTIDGICSPNYSEQNDNVSGSGNLSAMEKELNWLCANACRLMISATPLSLSASSHSPNQTAESTEKQKQKICKLIREHGSLLKGGLNVIPPTLNEIVSNANWLKHIETPDMSFLKTFIEGDPDTPAGALARAISLWPFVDIWNSFIRVEHSHTLHTPQTKQPFTVGDQIKISFVARDQHNLDVIMDSKFKVEILISNKSEDEINDIDNVEFGHQPKNDQPSSDPSNNNELSETTFWNSLKTLQKVEEFSPVYLNKARYQCICMAPMFSDFSMEELRFAYYRTTTLVTVRLKLEPESAEQTSPNTFKTIGPFCTVWVPWTSGRYFVSCQIDGIKIKHSKSIDILDMNRSYFSAQNSKKAFEIKQEPTAMDPPEAQEINVRKSLDVSRANFPKKAFCQAICAFRAVRIRSHPTLRGTIRSQIGLVPRGATFFFTEIVRNSDGTWLLLSDEDRILRTLDHRENSQAWCLQYNNHLNVEYLSVDGDQLSLNATEAPQPQNAGISFPEKHTNKTMNILSATVNAHRNAKSQSIQSLVPQKERRKTVFSEFSENVKPPQDFRININEMNKTSSLNMSDPNNLTNSEDVSLVLGATTIECLRWVFAASIWHSQGKVEQLMACSNHLRSRSLELYTILKQISRSFAFNQKNFRQFHLALKSEEACGNLPIVMSNIISEWIQITESVLSTIKNRKLRPSSISHEFICSTHYNGISAANKNISGANNNNCEGYCELCKGYFPNPITAHMRREHPGCGGISFNHGYNSTGNYTTGWTGICGEGGQGTAVWYLMCPNCRAEYLKRPKKGGKLAATQPIIRQKNRQAGKNSGSTYVEAIIQQNAAFLLELKPAQSNGKSLCSAKAKWSIDMYPQSTQPQTSHKSATPQNACSKNVIDANIISGDSEINLVSGKQISHQRITPNSNTMMDDVEDEAQDEEDDTVFEHTRLNNTVISLTNELLQANAFQHLTHVSDPGIHYNRLPEKIYEKQNESLLKIANNNIDNIVDKDDGMHDDFEDEVILNELSSFSASANLYGREFGVKNKNILLSSPGLKDPQRAISYSANESHRVPKLYSFKRNVFSKGKELDGELAQLPVVVFITQNHDLKLLRHLFYESMVRAVGFSYSFRVWNWLLKMVTSESSVMDIVWHYLMSLSSYEAQINSNMAIISTTLSFATRVCLLPHPWRLCILAGDQLISDTVDNFHSFLTSLAVILQSDSVKNIRLKCLCFRAWTFQLTIYEKDVLLTLCNLLATVGSILADGSESLDRPTSTPHTSTQQIMGMFSSHNINNNTNIASDNNCNRVSAMELKNIANLVKIDASSRPQLLPCLFDGSNETFWESGTEDKTRGRHLTVNWETVNKFNVTFLTLLIDNVRDEGFRVSQIIIQPLNFAKANSPIFNENTKKKIFSGIQNFPLISNNYALYKDMAVDKNFSGWIKCNISGLTGVKITLHGDDCGCRIRQLGVYAETKADRGQADSSCQQRREESASGAGEMKPSASNQLFFSTAQMDAFALFQAIAAQAFSDEFAEEQNGTLREQVLDLLFNRSQLQPLQSYVCLQMVNAVQREVINLRERGRRNFSYVCGLLVMLVKICESRQGLEIFSSRNGLLTMLSELLLFAPQVVQIQVIETIERLYGHFKPFSFDSSQFMENIFVVLAKAISLQIKDKATRKINSYMMANHAVDIPAIWRMDRQVVVDVAHMLLRLLNKIANGNSTPTASHDERWAVVIRTEIANNIMRLINILSVNSDDPFESSERKEILHKTKNTVLAKRLQTVQFWLSVTSLAVIDDSRWLELSLAWQNLKAHQSQEPDSFCENHDDSKTLSQVHCENCDIDLCRECFTILHLNRRNKGHQMRLVGSAANVCPRIEIHEGCTRLRLGGLLILFNPQKLSGVVEVGIDELITATALTNDNDQHPPELQKSHANLRSDTNVGAKKCRFCSNLLMSDMVHLEKGVCDYPECIELSENACSVIFSSCGHWCGGIRGETSCPPCLNCGGSAQSGVNNSKNTPRRGQDADDLCAICFTDRLGEAPCIELKCAHIFHFHCIRKILEIRWTGARIAFRFMQCPLCKAQIEHENLEDLLAPLRALSEDVSRKAKLRLEYDGLLNHPAVTSQNSTFFADPIGYALERYMYVLCSNCRKAYFGGENRCQEQVGTSLNFDPKDLICGGCSNVAGGSECGRHGAEYLEYKCRYCCSVAVYFCFGTTHFCAGCHSDFPRLISLPKHQLPQCPVAPRGIQLPEDESCPLKLREHPPTGEEFALGCGVCRNLRTF